MKAAAWKGLELLDRQSVLVDEDGNRDVLDPDFAAAVRAQFDGVDKATMNEILYDLGIVSMEDLAGESLESVFEGIFD